MIVFFAHLFAPSGQRTLVYIIVFVTGVGDGLAEPVRFFFNSLLFVFLPFLYFFSYVFPSFPCPLFLDSILFRIRASQIILAKLHRVSLRVWPGRRGSRRLEEGVLQHCFAP